MVQKKVTWLEEGGGLKAFMARPIIKKIAASLRKCISTVVLDSNLF